MCLDTVQDEVTTKRAHGYKVVRKLPEYHSSDYSPQYSYDWGRGGYKTGEWVTSTTSSTHLSYPTGFHIFTELTEAKYYCGLLNLHWVENLIVVRVQFKDVVAQGTQMFNLKPLKVVVARNMKILPDKQSIQENTTSK